MALRVVFLGTPAISVPTLEALLADARFDVLGAITQPDKPSGRGQKLQPPPVKTRALAAGLPVFQPRSLRKDDELLAWLRAQNPDFLVTIAFGQILSQDVLEIPAYGTVNVHASLLPEYRGANPIQQAVLDGRPVTGLTTMLTDIGVDTGAMLLKCELALGPDETTGELAARMAEAAGPLLCQTLAAYAAGELTPAPQDEALATHAPKRQKQDAAIDWRRSARDVHRQICAFSPAPGAYCQFNGERIKLLASTLSIEADAKTEESLKMSAPGTIGVIIKAGVLVRAGDGWLCVKTLQPAGKKPMQARDWAQNLPRQGEPPRFENVLPDETV